MDHLLVSHCNFEPTGEINDAGWRKHRCTRCGYVSVFIPPWSNRIVRQCGDRTPPAPSVGSELMELFAEHGLEARSTCHCKRMAAMMDGWGLTGCGAHRPEILAHLRKEYEHASWVDRMRAAGNAALSGLAFKLDWSDPCPGLLDEAMRRTEAKESLCL
jgi:hypothetical protein